MIMLTTTDDPREVQRCYELGCSVYITKPVDYQSLSRPSIGSASFSRSCAFPDYGQAGP